VSESELGKLANGLITINRELAERLAYTFGGHPNDWLRAQQMISAPMLADGSAGDDSKEGVH
jgi:plasmid maintenance system antidote protein VapI